jgi:hypothetical protein
MLTDYWCIEYGNQKFFSFKDAADALGDKFKNAYFNFFDKSFMAHDWSIEPSESFEELKKIRAQQIRDTYSYIRLQASYAADSGTVINTFLKNGIFVDEILNYVSLWENELTDVERVDREKNFIPKIKEFIKNSPSTKISLMDLTAKEVFHFIRLDDKNLPGIVPSRFNVSRLNNTWELTRNGIDLYGESKPILIIDKGRFYSTFSFSAMHDWIGRGEGVDYFFTTPLFPKLHIKQCHMVKNKIKNEKADLILQSWDRPIRISESLSFADGSSMEPFIENACRDFTDFGLSLSKTEDTFLVKNAAVSFKEMNRVKGFYHADKKLLTDYLDFVRNYLQLPYFEKRPGEISKVVLQSNKYYLGM